MNPILRVMITRYPELSDCLPDIELGYEILYNSFRHNGKLLLCGNGGSAADCDHVVGELMKGFMSKRPLPPLIRESYELQYPGEGASMVEKLQGALPAISLVCHSALISAYANDVSPEMIYAQQVYGYGRPGDVLIAFSTSGNSPNILRALQIARMQGLKTIGFSGYSGGAMKSLCDVAICVPWERTTEIQERHPPIYHALCSMLEEAFFPT
ncbi:SIS domain-containing protein [Paenibacillus qinlingensis]|uniref:D-sedoheptulose 7-phosphate isomerase n=1 Tax=Paenibacillus qinlingensis TaxID=1837343 RepID=A0ABU1NTQ2_9BACL|nr:SIS domain-containing protein [Paenibacillus qinlingensis]MDR6550863.1 D-sedoheptulose 7-phosphate isomerase [Paenibacillus qinlingensis]